ncbi:MAG: tRNA (N(6)-L-threonylcarbamoyladenosine(37)-C(2))-methylthiotransferase MtaB [Proteobacteria bacterium]|nr:MAG: tRNA (N(6)-L-threonylcarbamoyladenosine(37)-C(2))-methylthiotransferase MtaB [Pseudomonadota bacterium]
MKKASIITLGCKVNQYESAAVRSAFETAGISVTPLVREADIIVINTCTVTGKAGAESRRTVRKAAKINENAPIIITGCHAQLEAERLKQLDIASPERICIISNDRKDDLVTHVLTASGQPHDLFNKAISDAKKITRLPVNRFGSRTRAYLKVQDGCTNFCSYCIVPYTRGRNRSLPKKEAVEQALRFREAGHREIVITGIHVGTYGNDLKEQTNIVDLLVTLCRSTPDINYRLSSIEPVEISHDLLTIMSEIDNLMPHLHIPLQSGDNDILKRMNRRYSREQFSSIIADCRSLLPDAAIGIDVLTGFPGETDRQFNNTTALLSEIDCTYLHVFPYSKRPGTVAADMKNQVDKQTKQKRVDQLRTLGNEKKIHFYRQHLTTSRPVLIEKEKDRQGNLKGFTDNYIPVIVTGDDTVQNSMVTARLATLENTIVRATITAVL